MSNATVGGVAQYNCTNLAPSLSTPTSVKFTATDMAGGRAGRWALGARARGSVLARAPCTPPRPRPSAQLPWPRSRAPAAAPRPLLTRAPRSSSPAAPAPAGLCSINDTYVFDLGVDQGYSLTVNPTYEINQCTAGATGSALIPVIIKHGGQITSKADIASKIAFEGPAGMCALQRYSGLLSAVPMTVNWLCQGLPAGTYNLKWTFNQNRERLSA